MAFAVPTFPLYANIWHDAGGSTYTDYTLPDVITPCNLAPGHRTVSQFIGGALAFTVVALFPALTDVRNDWNGNAQDLVELPAGSNRFYYVHGVEDFGKGFANEHRFAGIVLLKSGATFLVQGAIPLAVPLP